MKQREDIAGLDVTDLVERILRLPRGETRQLIAIAGAPASGKSTLAESLAQALNASGCTAATVPMDGFHLDNRLLDKRGLRARKGAPETFDADGFVALARRIKTEPHVFFPLFDRRMDLAVAGAGEIEAACDVAIFEGNYLLYDAAPWSGLKAMWDVSVWIETPEEVLLQRCVRRWLDHGHGPEAARERAERNDIANARRVVGARLAADITLFEDEAAAAAV